MYRVLSRWLVLVTSSEPPPTMLCTTALATRGSMVLATRAASTTCDVAIVGGGIVGLGAAQELVGRHPHLSVTLVEKERELAMHQTGHNSGVVHAGIYYKPGSLMARLCVEGMARTYEYCDTHSIPYKKVGKLVVATDALEEQRLLDLWERASQNGVPDLELVDRSVGGRGGQVLENVFFSSRIPIKVKYI